MEHQGSYENAVRRTKNKPVSDEILEAFDDALSYGYGAGLPAVPNYAEIERKLKSSMEKIWEEVGKIGRSDPPVDEAKRMADEVIEQELRKIQNEIGYLLTTYTVRYSHDEVEGVSPPDKYEIWIDIEKGEAYITGKKEPVKGVPYKLLLSYAMAPGRQRTQNEILSDKTIWDGNLLNRSGKPDPGALERLRQAHHRLANSAGKTKLVHQSGIYGISPDTSICIVTDT